MQEGSHMHFLITGGAGFIGSHLADRLLADGHRITAIDDLSTGRAENIEHLADSDRFQFVNETILNTAVLDRLGSDCDIIVHLAAAVGVKKIIDEPVETITTNVRGTEIVLDCCHSYGTPLYAASTSEIYGKAGVALHEEHDRIMGSTSHRRWAYACTKVLDEFLALAYHHSKGLPVVIGRFFNTVGPRQPGTWGMVLPTFVTQALKGEPITVYGTGEQMRSFCHVNDSIRAVLGLMDTEAAIGEVYNIGNEHEITMMELAEKVKEKAGSKSEIVLVSYEEAYGEGFEDMERRQPDTTKIHDLLGWETEYGMDDIIDDVIGYYRRVLSE